MQLLASVKAPVAVPRAGLRPPSRQPASLPAPRPLVRCQAAATEGKKAVAAPPPITLSDRALEHLTKLRAESGDDDKLLLRMGVKSGGCSGMSYVMDFEKEENLRPDDLVTEYDGGFRLACDPKSLLYLFGMELDWSPALVGGGFAFMNPNAESSCGCGKSFGV